jgi:hypothetical protein
MPVGIESRHLRSGSPIWLRYKFFEAFSKLNAVS